MDLQEHIQVKDWSTFFVDHNMVFQHMGDISQGVQSMEIMSYFLFFLATVFGNLEVWKVRK